MQAIYRNGIRPNLFPSLTIFRLHNGHFSEGEKEKIFALQCWTQRMPGSDNIALFELELFLRILITAAVKPYPIEQRVEKICRLHANQTNTRYTRLIIKLSQSWNWDWFLLISYLAPLIDTRCSFTFSRWRLLRGCWILFTEKRKV